jgi:hypothetical protein
MSNTITYTDELVTMICWCGTHHAVPETLYRHQRRCHDDGRSVPDIYCPLGHTHVPAGKGKAELERERRERAERALANRDEDLRAERASHAATKGALTKARKRATAGVCPCCHRSFVNVRRHIETCHPGELEHATRSLP